MFPRIRDILGAGGDALRLSVEACPVGALVVIADPHDPDAPGIVLDGYGAELLAGFIMSARLALPYGLADEITDGAFGTRFSLATAPEPVIHLSQATGSIALTRPFWEKLYAELGIVLAHSRRIGDGLPMRLH